jgi:(2Fe-2S) ferredoxin
MKPIIYVCTNKRGENSAKPSCARRESEALLAEFKTKMETAGVTDKFDIEGTGCLGACEDGITVMFFEEQVWYGNVQPTDIDDIIESHIKSGKPVERLLIKRLMLNRRLASGT